MKILRCRESSFSLSLSKSNSRVLVVCQSYISVSIIKVMWSPPCRYIVTAMVKLSIYSAIPLHQGIFILCHTLQADLLWPFIALVKRAKFKISKTVSALAWSMMTAFLYIFYMYLYRQLHLADHSYTVGTHFQSFEFTMIGPKADSLQQIWTICALIKGTIARRGEQANSHGLTTIFWHDKAHQVSNITPYRSTHLLILPLSNMNDVM